MTWTDDGWQTTHTANSRAMGSAGQYADIGPTGPSEMEWTLRWPEKDAWLGYNVKVKVDAAKSCNRSLARKRDFRKDMVCPN